MAAKYLINNCLFFICWLDLIGYSYKFRVPKNAMPSNNYVYVNLLTLLWLINFVWVLTEKTIELFEHIVEVVQSEYYVRLDR
jgi:hypothetical protein